MDKELNKL